MERRREHEYRSAFRGEGKSGLRNRLSAGESAAGKFVDHESLEAVLDRVQVADPGDPAEHVSGVFAARSTLRLRPLSCAKIRTWSGLRNRCRGLIKCSMRIEEVSTARIKTTVNKGRAASPSMRMSSAADGWKTVKSISKDRCGRKNMSEMNQERAPARAFSTKRRLSERTCSWSW